MYDEHLQASSTSLSHMYLCSFVSVILLEWGGKIDLLTVFECSLRLINYEFGIIIEFEYEFVNKM